MITTNGRAFFCRALLRGAWATKQSRVARDVWIASLWSQRPRLRYSQFIATGWNQVEGSGRPPSSPVKSMPGAPFLSRPYSYLAAT